MELKVNVEAKDGQVIVLQGEAAQPINPKRQRYLGGNIRAVVDYVNGVKRTGKPVDPQTSIVVIDESALTITLSTETHLHDHGGVTVEAKLEPNERLQAFNINAENKRFSKEQLEKLFMFNADMFSGENANSCQLILASLRNFSAKVNMEIQESKDNRGNKANNFTKNVQTDIASSFVLVAPLFKGTDYKKFTVDICFEVTDGGVRFWLESPELYQLIIKEIQAQFSSQADFLSDKTSEEEGVIGHNLVVIKK